MTTEQKTLDNVVSHLLNRLTELQKLLKTWKKDYYDHLDDKESLPEVHSMINRVISRIEELESTLQIVSPTEYDSYMLDKHGFRHLHKIYGDDPIELPEDFFDGY